MSLFLKKKKGSKTPSNCISIDDSHYIDINDACKMAEPVVFNSVLDFPDPLLFDVAGLMAKVKGSPYTFVCWNHKWCLMTLEFDKPPETIYYRELKRALMQDILTNGMTPRKKERLEEAERELRYEA